MSHFSYSPPPVLFLFQSFQRFRACSYLVFAISRLSTASSSPPTRSIEMIDSIFGRHDARKYEEMNRNYNLVFSNGDLKNKIINDDKAESENKEADGSFVIRF